MCFAKHGLRWFDPLKRLKYQPFVSQGVGAIEMNIIKYSATNLGGAEGRFYNIICF
jgi:hypothetical protein